MRRLFERTLPYGLTLAFCALCAMSAWAQDDAASVDIPRIENVAIDGHADDWGDGGFRVQVLADHNGSVLPAEDFAPRFRLAWDDRGLLILFEVRDDVLVDDPDDGIGWYAVRHWSFYDLIQISSRPVPFDERHYVCGIAPLRDGGGSPLTRIYDRSMGEPQKGLRVEAAQGRLPDGYCVEVLLPWSNVDLRPEVGAVFGLQIAVSDFDGGKETFRACWVKAEKPVDHSKDVKMIRLSDEAAEEETVLARVSEHPGGLPWARFAATREHVGALTVVRRDGEVLREMPLREVDGWAQGSLLLPKPADGGGYGDLALELDGERIATEAMGSTGEGGYLSFKTSAAAEPGTAEIVVGLANDTQRLLAGTTVQAEIYSADGERVREIQTALETPSRTALKPGVYRIEAESEECLGWSMEGRGAFIAGDEKEIVVGLLARARKAQADPRYEAYAGWFDYLVEQVEHPHPPIADDRRAERPLELAEWLIRAERNLGAFQEMRGLMEWAYLSEADGNGQPFMIGIPHNYDPARAWPLDVWMHGGGGLHFDMAEDWSAGYDEEYIALSVLGRGGEGPFRDLSEVDVLDAVEYVQAHWNVDPRQVHVAGSSMGGYGAFNIAARHPDRFASARFYPGNGLHAPMRNMLHVPIFGLHDRLDWMSSVEIARVPLQRLDRFGGRTVLEESEEYGHGVIANRVGVERATEWALRQRLPESVDRVYYEATDGLAKGAYWAEVVEWGPQGRPATIDARIGSGNDLYLRLDNVNVVAIDLAESPADLSASMLVSINTKWFHEMPAPLPETLYVVREGDGWRLQRTAFDAPEERLHFPGGAHSLYQGEPILIVFGTQGDDMADRALYDIAQTARRSVSAGWPPGGQLQRGYPARYSLYGMLPSKADTDVTEDDLLRYNLVLLGDADQNALVARIAERLPVHIDGDRVVSNDGLEWSFEGRALGLLHYNPLAPKRLIYWVAAGSLEFYQPQASLLEWQRRLFTAPDFMLMRTEGSEVVAARRLDSRWNWESGYGDSPRVSIDFAGREGNARVSAEAIRRAVNADFGLAELRAEALGPVHSPGETRVMDVAVLDDRELVCVMELSGEDLLEAARKTEDAGRGADGAPGFLLHPQVKAPDINPDRTYRIAVMSGVLRSYIQLLRMHPPYVEQTDVALWQAWERNWPLIVEDAGG